MIMGGFSIDAWEFDFEFGLSEVGFCFPVYVDVLAFLEALQSFEGDEFVLLLCLGPKFNLFKLLGGFG